MQREMPASVPQAGAPPMGFGKYLNCRWTLAVMCSLIVAIIILRFYHLSVTGYLLPDEAYYYETIVLDHELLDRREIFAGIFGLFFGGVKDIPSMALMGAFFASAWGVGSAFLSYKIVRTLGMSDAQTSLLLVSMLLFPVYVIMLPMVTTETVGFFLALCGILFVLRFHQKGRWFDAIASLLAFLAAYKVREAYLLFAFANFFGILLSDKRSTRVLLAWVIPLALVFPVPDSLWPPQFGKPLYALLLSWLAPSSPTLVPTIPAGPLDVPVDKLLKGTELSLFLYAFATGLFFGYNPIFAILAIVSLFLAFGIARRRRTAVAGLPPWNALAGLGAYSIALLLLSGLIYPASGLISGWTSVAIRAAHPSLPVVFTLNHAYHKIGSKKVAAMLVLLLVVGSTQLPVISQAVQSNLSRTGADIDRLSLDYRAPYYRLYELAKVSGRTIVFALNLRGARTYLSMLPNVQVFRVPANETKFDTLLAEGWDTIYLYDNWYTVADPSSLQLYPQYYREILISHAYQGYTVQTVWVDGESYAFKMTPVALTQE